MTPAETKHIFLQQAPTPYIYIVKGLDINNNSNDSLYIAKIHGMDVGLLTKFDRIIIQYDKTQLEAELRPYQIYDYIGKFPRVKPNEKASLSLHTVKLSPIFMAATRLSIQQYYVNDPTMPLPSHGKAHTYKAFKLRK